ncbi:MAG: ABC transporter permease [Cellulosilyticaceae bacterium]
MVPLIVALLLNEVSSSGFKRSVQTIIYLPHFLSWVILSTIFIDLLSPSTGAINQILGVFGVEPIYFLGDQKWFPITMVITDVWKGFGYGTIVYLAALTGIDPTLYESALIDGANRWKQTWHITLPGIRSMIVLMMILQLGNVLNAGFDQIYNMMSPIVYKTGDIIDTLVYRMGLIDAQYSLATAVGLFKSVISLVLIMTSYKLADKYAGYKIF